MPKSRNRKNHKKKVMARKLRLINERNHQMNLFKKAQEEKIDGLKAEMQKDIKNSAQQELIQASMEELVTQLT